MIFQNRTRDLAALDRCRTGGKAAFVVVYGRRRIGKTVLLRHWVEKHARHVFWTAYRTTPDVLLTSISQSIATLTPELHVEVKFTGWEPPSSRCFSSRRPHSSPS